MQDAVKLSTLPIISRSIAQRELCATLITVFLGMDGPQLQGSTAVFGNRRLPHR
jgi:hypothetical protein